MAGEYKPRITDRDREVLTTEFDVGALDDDPEAVLDLLTDIEGTDAAPFESMGAAIRNDLSESLDADLLDSAVDDLEAVLEDAESVREAGIPERHGPGDAGVEELYRELIAPVWEAYYHLIDVGFFERIEDTLPGFTEEHLDHTAEGTLATGMLTDELANVGFDEHERTALLLDLVSNDTRLSHWVQAKEIPEGVEFDVDYVPPLYHRAVGGGLLWVKALDRHLKQKEILLTDSIVDDAFWRTKAILGGVYLFLRAAHAVANDDGSSDRRIVAALSSGAAITIVNQEELMQEAFWINEENRAPSPAR
ncbi:hypothetical protein [Haloplanus natans]|uniref:hypothetical protein n=1 Tax=Haloplanus natans TaxID=376171 RepID=UPI00067760E0|nr:hypothetical protein [Haloplanus natans]